MKNEKQKHNINNIFYGVIGVATLIVAVIGATFAYYTATETNTASITGNMATIQFDVTVAKVNDADDEKGGMIPMSNNMMEQALKSSAGICIDNNGNAVCQVYKITVVNTGTSSMFLDGYVTLTGGSGTADDISKATGAEGLYETSELTGKTTMRWAQAFCSEDANGEVSSCTTTGNSTVRATSTITMSALGGTSTQSNGFNSAEILTTKSEVTTTATISNNTYDVINTNYIRISDRTSATAAYDRTNDVTSALVYSQYLNPNDNNATNNTGTSSTTFTDAQVYYIVIWLSENGHNQTASTTGVGTNGTGEAFYQGKVTFISAQGHEVTATFADHAKVAPTY